MMLIEIEQPFDLATSLTMGQAFPLAAAGRRLVLGRAEAAPGASAANTGRP